MLIIMKINEKIIHHIKGVIKILTKIQMKANQYIININLN